MKIFVCYTTRDAEITINLLKKISKKLSTYGVVFIDIIDNNSTNKQLRVISELESSDLIVVIESKSIYQSEWVALEIKKAKLKKIPIKILQVKELSNFTL